MGSRAVPASGEFPSDSSAWVPYEPGKNQTVEAIRVLGIVVPPKVDSAVSAEGNRPVESGKPREFSRRAPLRPAAWCRGEAANTKRDPGRVDKGVFMPAVHLQETFKIRNLETTRGATKDVPPLFCRNRFLPTSGTLVRTWQRVAGHLQPLLLFPLESENVEGRHNRHYSRSIPAPGSSDDGQRGKPQLRRLSEKGL